MNDDKLKKDSDLSENKEGSAADRRFDVLDSVDFNAGDAENADKKGDVESTLDELLSELDDLTARTNLIDDTPDFSEFAGSANFEPAQNAQDAAADLAASEVAQAAAASIQPKPSAPKQDAPKQDAPKQDAPKRRDPLADMETIEFDHGAVAKRGEAGSKAQKNAAQNDAPAKNKTAGSTAAANGAKSAAPAGGAAKKGESQSDVDRAAKTISSLIEGGKLSSALDLVLCLRGAFRQSVREKAHVTIPLGSRDSDLRRIAAGALIQSYLEQGKIVRRDIENKLYAIIESSEPEYDEDDEIVEQTPQDVLYKVAACMVFAAELTEKSGNHPDEKSAMYASGDSVLDQFLADNLGEVYRTNKKRLATLASAVAASGGEVAAKFAKYYDDVRGTGETPAARFLGNSTAFKAAAAIVALFCFITLLIYIVKFPSSGINASLINFIAKENGPIMLFAIAAEVFAIIGIGILCVILYSGKSDKNAGGGKK